MSSPGAVAAALALLAALAISRFSAVAVASSLPALSPDEERRFEEEEEEEKVGGAPEAEAEAEAAAVMAPWKMSFMVGSVLATIPVSKSSLG